MATNPSEQDIVQGAPALTQAELTAALEGVPGWELSPGGKAISRGWKVKNFARAAQLANLVVWLAENANHHPDLQFGWGYVTVTFTTHSAGGVTMNDVIMAARIDALTA